MSVDDDRLASACCRYRKAHGLSSYGFTSAFATPLDEYLAFKKNMGFYGGSRIWYLKRFDAYCTEHGRAVLTVTPSRHG